MYNLIDKQSMKGEGKRMNKFTFDNMPQLRVLSNEQVKEMHEKALYVLENLGIIFAYDEALDLLEGAGCEVDRTT